MNEKIRDIDAMAKKILEDEELMNAIDRLEMAMIDENLKLQSAFENGEEKGKKENSKEIAKEMKKIKIPIEQIIQVTGLSKEEVEKL